MLIIIVEVNALKTISLSLAFLISPFWPFLEKMAPVGHQLPSCFICHYFPWNPQMNCEVQFRATLLRDSSFCCCPLLSWRAKAFPGDTLGSPSCWMQLHQNWWSFSKTSLLVPSFPTQYYPLVASAHWLYTSCLWSILPSWGFILLNSKTTSFHKCQWKLEVSQPPDFPCPWEPV